jgi:holo-[acyl-carrier protein] synthase
MPILGHGIDAVEVSRIASMLDRHADRFLERCFTAGERAYADASRRRVEHYAARFAAKEAILKALGTGWSRGIDWKDAEIVRDDAGAPGVRLHGAAARIAFGRGIARWSISLSHTPTHAFASAIAESEA